MSSDDTAVDRDDTTVGREQTTPEVAPRPRLVRRSPWKLVFIGAVLFACGLVAGTGVALLLMAGRMTRPVSPDRLVDRMNQTMALSDAQQEQIKAILTAHHPVFEQQRQAMRDELDNTTGEIKAVLTTPEQAKAFEAVYQRWQQFIPGSHSGHPYGHGGGAPGHSGAHHHGEHGSKPQGGTPDASGGAPAAPAAAPPASGPSQTP
jgi:hypothetical protein